MNTNYPIEALEILLCRDCLPERYYPLISFTDGLITGLRQLGCRRKADTLGLPDSALFQIGLPDGETVKLLRRFLVLYDPDPRKFREIPKVAVTAEEQAAFRELYVLPGVKATRASLYFRSGYKALADFADTTAAEVREHTARVISEQHLSCVIPQPKEIRTHIAVAKAFLMDTE